MSLSSLIVQREIATIRQVEEALARQVLYGGDLVTNMLEVAKVDEATLTLLLAESFGLAAATLGPLPNPSERVRSMVSGETASSRALVPLSVENGALVIAVAEPLPKDAEDDLAYALGLRLVQRVAPMVRVREALSKTYGAPIERRLQRLLTRLGSTAAPSSIPQGPPASSRAGAAERPSSRTSPGVQPAAQRSAATRAGGTGRLDAGPSEWAGVASGPVTERSEPPLPKSAPLKTFVHRPGPAAAPPLGPIGARAPKRRRGPITPEQAATELAEAGSRDAILDLFFDYARQYFDYSALFVVHADIAEGREAFGDGASREKVQTIGVPLDLPSILASARDASAAIRVAPAHDGLDAVLLGDLERKTHGEVLVVPVIVRKRAVALLYGDSGDDGPDPAAVRQVVAFGLLVGQAFEKLIVRMKAEGLIASSKAPPVRPRDTVPEPPPPPASPEPPVREPAPPFPEPVGWRGAARPVPHPSGSIQRSALDLVDAATSAVDQLLDQTPSPGKMRVEEPPYQFAAPPDSPRALIAHPSDRPPPPNAFVLRRPSGPPIPREEPVDSDRAPRSSSAPPPSESFAVAPHLPPSSRLTDDLVLPSVIVDVSEELVALVDKVVAVGSDESAETELLRQGQQAMPAIMSRFPGPTVVDRARVEDGSLRVAECGTVLRLIAGQRRAALPFVLPIVGDGETQRRYWATFLLTELAYPEAVEPLVPRLFDPDMPVRRVARLAARAVGEVAPEALIERLVRYYRDPTFTQERRIETIDTLGELRERLAVPLLIDALGGAEEHVAAAARRALVTISRQDLGRDARKWQAWWAQNGGRHRLEWLIDALMHEVPAIRRAAGDELKALTKEYFGYYDDLPRKEREQAQARYREWWRSEGRLRFQRR